MPLSWTSRRYFPWRGRIIWVCHPRVARWWPLPLAVIPYSRTHLTVGVSSRRLYSVLKDPVVTTSAQHVAVSDPGSRKAVHWPDSKRAAHLKEAML